jgi:ATP-dependent Clp protease ATP-binding subunit ClpA
MQMDDDSKRMELWVKGLPQQEEPKKEKKAKIKIENFVIFADEYSSVNEHVIINFIDFLGKLSPTNMYIQNPPMHLLEQIYRVYGDKNIIQEKRQDYEVITEKSIVTINNDFDNRIIGQNAVKQQLLKAIFPVMNNAQDKPVVILFYGNSGLGKTETAQFLTETIGGKMLRKQFSMYQNNEFANYLFGGKYNEKSFAKDLVSRDANVILLDEFDKANPLFHSAFYQLFDEGIFEDQNYKVDVKHAVIICTSNYQSKDEVKEKLGIPIYNRFDAVIRFDELSNEAKMLIANKELNELDSSKVLGDDIHNNIIEGSCILENAREIRKLIKDTISLYQIRRICQKSCQECEN